MVAGLGSGRISLFSGEIYAGYASQRFEDPRAGTQPRSGVRRPTFLVSDPFSHVHAQCRPDVRDF